MMIATPRGKYFGKRLGDPPKDEAEHFIRCQACDGWIDCRDLGQVFDNEGPLPHPAQDQPQ
jgi:CRISPR/Cas system type I-B associated protein Csh2 (Cas7 group RAMP superfamily)